eukprot:scaffold18214_cov28-Phaeocystis_antarctica.AAC.1
MNNDSAKKWDQLKNTLLRIIADWGIGIFSVDRASAWYRTLQFCSVVDESRSSLAGLHAGLPARCVSFSQKSIYLSIAFERFRTLSFADRLMGCL